MTDLFLYKSPAPERLLAYGFSENAKGFSYCKEIFDGQFSLMVSVGRDGNVRTELLDKLTEEPYTLHLVEGAAGEFVGRVREEYFAVLREISERCFVREVFREPFAKQLISDVLERNGEDLEFLWERFPDAAVWRRKDNAKWYAVLMIVARKKLGMEGEGKMEISVVRADPREVELLIDGKRIFPAYHMNKKHWIALPLDGTLPYEELLERIEESRFLAGKK